MSTEKQNTLREAGTALRNGDSPSAIVTLRSYLSKRGDDSDVFNALIITLQRAKDWAAAETVIEQALQSDPQNLQAWMLKGGIEERSQRPRLALQAYKTAQQLGAAFPPSKPGLIRDLNQLSSRIPALMQQLEAQTYQRFKTLGLRESHAEDARFAETLDILFGKKEIFYQQPHQLYVPGLPQKQFYDPYQFEWAKDLIARTPQIKSEIKTIARNPALFAPYLESGPGTSANSHNAMVDNSDWSAFYLIKDGKEVEGAREICPETFDALRAVDLCQTQGGTPSVLFSLLKPGAHIPPHTGMLNCRLICHLPLIVPPACGLRVGNQTIEWTEGELIAFDDSIEHEAWNHSQDDRIVLLFDVWRPEISLRERELISELLEFSNQDA